METRSAKTAGDTETEGEIEHAHYAVLPCMGIVLPVLHVTFDKINVELIKKKKSYLVTKSS